MLISPINDDFINDNTYHGNLTYYINSNANYKLHSSQAISNDRTWLVIIQTSLILVPAVIINDKNANAFNFYPQDVEK